jgi:HlyD family secretion protein
MLKKITPHLACVFALILLFSCQKQEIKEPSTFTIIKTDFEDILPIEGLVETAQSSIISCPNDVDGTIQFLIDNGTHVKPGDTVCIIEDKDMSKRYDAAVKALETAKGIIDKSKIELDIQYALVEAEAKRNDGEREMARLDSLQLEYATPTQRKIKELELQKKILDRKQLDRKLKDLAIINQSELRALNMNLMRYTMEVQNLKMKLEGLSVKATQPGLALIANHYTGRKLKVGDNVWNGRQLYFVPNLSQMKIKLSVPEGQYKRIEMNNPVEYSFDAMPGNKAWGKISQKASVGRSVKEGSKVKMFELEASIDSFKTIPGPDLSVKCRILLTQIKDTIAIPQVAIFDQDSMKVAYVRKKHGYEMRQIIVGTSSTKEAVVAAGLRPKEKIALTKPDPSLITSKKNLSKAIQRKYKKLNNSNNPNS